MVPHVAARKTHQQLWKFLLLTSKRVLQHNPSNNGHRRLDRVMSEKYQFRKSSICFNRSTLFGVGARNLSSRTCSVAMITHDSVYIEASMRWNGLTAC
jgi:hypothetical protein